MRTLTTRILIVGDDSVTCDLLVIVLNRAGCRASTCTRREAFSVICDSLFDLILIDWLLECDRVVGFYKAVRAQAPNTPVRLFTGDTPGWEVRQALRTIKGCGLPTLSLDALLAEVGRGPGASRDYQVRFDQPGDPLKKASLP